MRYLLSGDSRERLRHFAAGRLVCAFDFDGTLAPIVKRPENARMAASTRLRLSQLARVRPCVVLSGRSKADLKELLAGTGVRHLIGNHGAEQDRQARRLREKVQRWRRTLADELPNLPGLWVEDKALSLTVHYRECVQKASARAAILHVSKGLEGVRVVGGKQAVSFVARDAPHKGDALLGVLSRLKYERAIYVGDDATDEDVFSLPGAAGNLLTVRIGVRTGSRARFYLRKQREIDTLLDLLLSSSQSPSRARTCATTASRLQRDDAPSTPHCCNL